MQLSLPTRSSTSVLYLPPYEGQTYRLIVHHFTTEAETKESLLYGRTGSRAGQGLSFEAWDFPCAEKGFLPLPSFLQKQTV